MMTAMFAQRLRELRIEKDLSQKELADVLDISNRTISMYETGNSEPNVDILVKLSKFFEVTSDYLVGFVDDKTATNTYTKLQKYIELSEISGTLEEVATTLMTATDELESSLNFIAENLQGSKNYLEQPKSYILIFHLLYKTLIDLQEEVNALEEASI